MPVFVSCNQSWRLAGQPWRTTIFALPVRLVSSQSTLMALSGTSNGIVQQVCLRREVVGAMKGVIHQHRHVHKMPGPRSNRTQSVKLFVPVPF